MKHLPLLALVFASAAIAFAASSTSAASAPSESKTQKGQLSTVSLLATARISGRGAPDGIRFLFLISRSPDAVGNVTLKETRDFLVAGESYQEKTQAELGQGFEPSTVFDTAENFFEKQPGIRHLAPKDIAGAYVLAVAIGGAPLETGAKVETTVHVGFEKQVEPFTFLAKVPPASGAR